MSDELKLTSEDVEFLVNLAENPPEPTAGLVEDFSAYRNAVESGRLVIESRAINADGNLSSLVLTGEMTADERQAAFLSAIGK